MTGRTHFVVGANTAWIAYFLGAQDYWLFVFMIAGGLAGLLPDIDTRKSELSHATGGLTRMFFIDLLFRHRSATHSLMAILLVGVASSFLYQFHAVLPLPVIAGYASHPFIDGFNPQGCEYFYPNKNNYRLIPRFLCVDTGGWADHLLFFVCCLSLLALLFVSLGWIQIALG